MGPGRLDSHTSPAGSGRHKTQLLVVASVGVLKHPARVSCNKVIHQGKKMKVSGQLIDEADGDGEWSAGSRIGAVGTASGSVHGSVDSGMMEAAVMEQTIDAAHKGQGYYAVGSRWHEATLREMMKAIGSPSLAWRYGDG